MDIWAITVKAPPLQMDVQNALSQFAQSLVDRPFRRSPNVLGFELFSADTTFSPPMVRCSLLLLTIDVPDTVELEALVEDLKGKLPEGFEVFGIELQEVEKSSASRQ